MMNKEKGRGDKKGQMTRDDKDIKRIEEMKNRNNFPYRL
jgi:hypothetical protein